MNQSSLKERLLTSVLNGRYFNGVKGEPPLMCLEAAAEITRPADVDELAGKIERIDAATPVSLRQAVNPVPAAH